MAEFARALQSQNVWFNRGQYLAAEIKLAQFRLGVEPASVTPAVSAAASPKPVQKEAKSEPKASPKSEPKTQAAPKSENKAAKMVSDLKEYLVSDNTKNESELSSMLDRVLKLEQENQDIRSSLEKALERLEILEKNGAFKPEEKEASPAAKPAPVPAKKDDDEDDDDDDDDFFASSDEDDEEAKKAAEDLKAKRIAEYNARKAVKDDKKGKTIAKSSITFDVKPWDDETDLDEVCKRVKAIEMPGLIWGASQKKPMAYGIFKLCVTAVVEDDKVSSDDLVELIEAFEDAVQSVDIAAFQKI